MSNVQIVAKSFNEVAKLYVALEKKEVGIFGELLAWAAVNDLTADNAKDKFKAAEAGYLTKSGNDLQKLGSYRSAKSVINSALKAGVSLVDATGILKAKSQLEAETKDAKGDKSEIEKFDQLFGTLATIADKLAGKDKLAAKAKLEALIAKMK